MSQIEIGEAILAKLDIIVTRLDTLTGLLSRPAPPQEQPRQTPTEDLSDAFLDAYDRVVRDLAVYLARQTAAGKDVSARQIERRWTRLRGGLPISVLTLRRIIKRAIRKGDLIRAPLGWLSAPPDK